MELPGFIHKIHKNVEDEHHWLTRRKLAVFGATLILAGLLIGAFESSAPEQPAARPDVIDLPLPERKPATGQVLPGPGNVPEPAAPGEQENWTAVTVRSGPVFTDTTKMRMFWFNLNTDDTAPASSRACTAKKCLLPTERISSSPITVVRPESSGAR